MLSAAASTAIALLLLLAGGSSHATDWRSPGSQRCAVTGDCGSDIPPRRSRSSDSSDDSGPDPKITRHNDKVHQANAASNAKNYREALRLAHEAQAEYYDSKYDSFIHAVEAAIAAQDAAEAVVRAEQRLVDEKADYERKRDLRSEQLRKESDAKAAPNRSTADRLVAEAAAQHKAGKHKEATEKALKALELVPGEKAYRRLYWDATVSLRNEEGDLSAMIEASEEKVLASEPNDEYAKPELEMLKSHRVLQGELLAPLVPQLRSALADTSLAAAGPREASAVALPRQADEIEASPAAEDARKGFAAVAARDWAAAAAWYRSALQKDPGNKALARMVSLADDTLARERKVAAETKWALIRRAPPSWQAAIDRAGPPKVSASELETLAGNLDAVFMRQFSDELARDALRRGIVQKLVYRNTDAAIAELKMAHETAPWDPFYVEMLRDMGYTFPDLQLPKEEDIGLMFQP